MPPQLPANQCPVCSQFFKTEGSRRSHQAQSSCRPQHNETTNDSVADVPSPTSSRSATPSVNTQHTASGTDASPNSPSGNVMTSPIGHILTHEIPPGSPRGGPSITSAQAEHDVEMESARASTRSRLVTTEEELADQIRKMLNDMIQERTSSCAGPDPRAETSSDDHMEDTSSGTGPSQSGQFVTMRRLPNDVDQAIAEFITHVFGPHEEPPHASDSEDEELGESFGDNRSETEANDSDDPDQQFYTAANTSIEDVQPDLPPEAPAAPEISIPLTEQDGVMHGARIRPCPLHLEVIHQERVAAGKAPAWPFADYLEFEFVKWMVDNDISQTARDKLIKLPIITNRCGLSFGSNYSLNQLLDKLPTAGPRWKRIVKTITGTIPSHKPGKMLTEEVEIWVRDIIEVVRELIGNAAYGQKLVFALQRVYLNGDRNQRKIDDMWTADWWWRIQHDKDIPPGATIVPIILSSDATQLTNFSGGQSAWPVYISIGNIPKSIRAKVNSYSTLLLAYLPVAKLHCFPEKERGDQKARLFHECMKTILEPLHTAGKLGVEMNCGDGFVRHCFPILAAYIADNPEQTLIACCRRNLCHRCTVARDSRGDFPNPPAPNRNPMHTANALKARDYGHTSALFDEQGLKQFGTPFWDGLPFANIFSCLTPDILHQLHKGVFKEHLMNWCIELLKTQDKPPDSIDFRYKLVPRHSDLRHFVAGVTKLKQSTANEHKEMQKSFIAVMAGLVPEDVLPVIIAIIDFIYYAQLPVHTSGTLDLLHDAFQRFHSYKGVFEKYNIRSDFNINKIHAMSHYFESIWELGTADGYNTETPERLHIEFAKRAYKATNRRQFFEQMTIYLQRREQVAKFDSFLRFKIPAYAQRVGSFEDDFDQEPSVAGWKLARKSPQPPFSIDLLQRTYGINWFRWCLDKCLAEHFPHVTLKSSPFDTFETFPKASQIINDAFASGQPDIVHASPSQGGSTRSKFDTVLIRKGEAATPVSLSQPSYGIASHYIGRVRLIFKLPAVYGIDTPLACVQLFKGPSQVSNGPIKRVNMYRVERSRYTTEHNHQYAEEIIPLNFIRRTCHLLPAFGAENVAVDGSEFDLDPLEMFEKFYLNSYFDLHTFQFL